MDKDKKIIEELIKEANSNGFNVEDFNELNAIKRKIKILIPILIRYLFEFEKKNYKDAIVGILGVKGFYEATETLLNLYFNNDILIDRWAIGEALYSIQDKRFENEYIQIVEDKNNGDSRQMIVILLGKLRCEKAIPILIDLLQDDDVEGHAIMALGHFKDKNLIEYIKPFLNNKKTWVRREAEKAIRKIDNSVNNN